MALTNGCFRERAKRARSKRWRDRRGGFRGERRIEGNELKRRENKTRAEENRGDRNINGLGGLIVDREEQR